MSMLVLRVSITVCNVIEGNSRIFKDSIKAVAWGTELWFWPLIVCYFREFKIFSRWSPLQESFNVFNYLFSLCILTLVVLILILPATKWSIRGQLNMQNASRKMFNILLLLVINCTLVSCVAASVILVAFYFSFYLIAFVPPVKKISWTRELCVFYW